MLSGREIRANLWALVVGVLYALTIAVLALPAILLAFIGEPWSADELGDVADALLSHWFWLVFGALVLAELALLVVPVRVASRRAAGKTPVFLTAAASGLAMGALFLGLIMAVDEFVRRGDSLEGEAWPLYAAGAAWLFWAVVFYRMGRRGEPRDLTGRICAWLMRGSVLELLVAVPTHVIARVRNYCCAGFGTFLGIALGLSVMLFSFGPGVFFLFVRRWRRLYPERSGDLDAPERAKAPVVAWWPRFSLRTFLLWQLALFSFVALGVNAREGHVLLRAELWMTLLSFGLLLWSIVGDRRAFRGPSPRRPRYEDSAGL